MTRPPKPEPRDDPAPLTENAVSPPRWATNPETDPAPRREPADPVKGFWGTVLLIGSDSVCSPDGRWCSGLYGFIKILPADITGMKPARGESPWVAQVSGEEEDVWVPGCKVGAVSCGSSHRDPATILTGSDDHNTLGLNIWEVP